MLCCGVLGAMSCAPAPSQVKVEDLNRQVAALRAQNVEQTRHIEELENQVFVLSDPPDGQQRVRQQQITTPHLPRVTLTPGQSVPGHDSEEPSAVYGVGDDDGVEYVGEAAKSSKSRPVLRLVGNEGSVSMDASAGALRPVAIAPPRAGGRRAPGVTAGAETRKLNLTAPDANAIVIYRQGLDHLKAGRHADAAAAFREFLRRYAQHDYADNAQYWLAECYYDLKDFVTAVREFRKVVEIYPQGNKVPDALLKVGFAYFSLGNEPAGRSTLAELVRSYPSHTAAAAAGEKLGELAGRTEDAAYAGAKGR